MLEGIAMAILCSLLFVIYLFEKKIIGPILTTIGMREVANCHWDCQWSYLAGCGGRWMTIISPILLYCIIFIWKKRAISNNRLQNEWLKLKRTIYRLRFTFSLHWVDTQPDARLLHHKIILPKHAMFNYYIYVNGKSNDWLQHVDKYHFFPFYHHWYVVLKLKR